MSYSKKEKKASKKDKDKDPRTDPNLDLEGQSNVDSSTNPTSDQVNDNSGSKDATAVDLEQKKDDQQDSQGEADKSSQASKDASKMDPKLNLDRETSPKVSQDGLKNTMNPPDDEIPTPKDFHQWNVDRMMELMRRDLLRKMEADEKAKQGLQQPTGRSEGETSNSHTSQRSNVNPVFQTIMQSPTKGGGSDNSNANLQGNSYNGHAMSVDNGRMNIIVQPGMLSELVLLKSLDYKDVVKFKTTMENRYRNNQGPPKISNCIEGGVWDRLIGRFKHSGRFQYCRNVKELEAAMNYLPVDEFLTKLVEFADGRKDHVQTDAKQIEAHIKSLNFDKAAVVTDTSTWGSILTEILSYIKREDLEEALYYDEIQALGKIFKKKFEMTEFRWAVFFAEELSTYLKQLQRTSYTISFKSVIHWIDDKLQAKAKKGLEAINEGLALPLTQPKKSQSSAEHEADEAAKLKRKRNADAAQATDKPTDKPKDTAKPTVTCTGCGRGGHDKNACHYKDHENWNSTNATWANSKMGMAWKKKYDKDVLTPPTKTLDDNVPSVYASRERPDLKRTKGECTCCALCASNENIEQAIIGEVKATPYHDSVCASFRFKRNTMTCDTCVLYDDDRIYKQEKFNVMFDNCSYGTNGNYISRRAKESLEANGWKTRGGKCIKVCSPVSSTCVTSCESVYCTIMLYDTYFNKSFKLKCLFYVIEDDTHDFILGLNTISSHITLANIIYMELTKGLLNVNREAVTQQIKLSFKVPKDTISEKHVETTQGPSRAMKGTYRYVKPIRGTSEWEEPEPSNFCAGLDAVEIDPEESDPHIADADVNKNIPRMDQRVEKELQRKQKELCAKYIAAFSRTLNKHPAKITPMTIKVTSDWRTIGNSLAPRLQSTERNAEIRRQVADMLLQEVIAPAYVSYYSQVLLTPKKVPGQWRFCIDFRRLNLCTEYPFWPLPNIKTMLNRLGQQKPKYFAVVDLTKGYYQAPLDENSRDLTAFITIDGVFRWNRVPMGLKGAPAYFQRVMATEVLAEHMYKRCEIYQDDLIVWGRTVEEYLHNLELILKRLIEVGITINPDKCQLGLNEVEYVGHVINEHGCKFSEEKLRSVLNVVLPRTPKELRSFLGLANYFRDHVRDHSTIVAPLTQLLTRTQKGKPLEWNDTEKDAFVKIKTAVYECPALFWVDSQYPVHVYTDASDVGIGAYVCQRYGGKEYPIAIMSKTLSSTQKRWSTIEKECFAIYDGLKTFEYLLSDCKFTLHTDHANLVYIRDSPDNKVIRWKMQIQPFDFELVHIKGTDNVVADFLSRNEASPVSDYIQESPDKVCQYLAALSMEEVIDEEDVHELNASWEQKQIPADKRAIIQKCHNCTIGHHGVDNTIANIMKLHEKWDYMRSHVKKYISECDICQRHDIRPNITVTKGYSTTGHAPFQCINMDIIGPLTDDTKGYKYILVLIDSFTRYVTAWPLKTNTGEEVANAILSHSQFFGVPCEFKTDLGTEFVNETIQQFLQLLGAEHIMTIAYSKEENSIVERANREIGRWIKNSLSGNRWPTNRWSEVLPFAVRTHNATRVISTGYTPSELVFGLRVNLDRGILVPPEERSDLHGDELKSWVKFHQDVQDEMIHKVKRLLKIHQDEVEGQIRVSGKKFKDSDELELTEFTEGDYVLVKYPRSRLGSTKPDKLLSEWRGPLQIIRRNGNSYDLRDIITKKEETKDVHFLKLYHYDSSITDPKVEAMKDHPDLWNVEKVLSHTGDFKRKNTVQFLVKWEGYDDRFNSNVSWHDLRNNELMHTYLKNINRSSLIPKRIADTEKDK